MTDRRIAYGFWRYGPGDLPLALTMLGKARDAGVTHFDTADVYGGRESFGAAESLLGEARKAAPSLFAGAEIATKAGVEYGTPYNSSKDYLAKAVEDSLRRLNVEQIDLFYIHRHDLLAHPAEVAEALDSVVAQGKVKSVGVSNYTPAQIDALRAFLTSPLAAHQAEFSLLHVEPLFNGVMDQAMTSDIAFCAWSPLAGGRVLNEVRVAAALETLAQEKDCAPSALALAFLLRHPASATPVIGTKNTARFSEAMRSLDVKLSRAEWYRLLEAALGRKMP